MRLGGASWPIGRASCEPPVRPRSRGHCRHATSGRWLGTSCECPCSPWADPSFRVVRARAGPLVEAGIFIRRPVRGPGDARVARSMRVARQGPPYSRGRIRAGGRNEKMDGLAVVGQGSEWLWAMAQFVAAAVTLVAMYRAEDVLDEGMTVRQQGDPPGGGWLARRRPPPARRNHAPARQNRSPRTGSWGCWTAVAWAPASRRERSGQSVT